MALTGRSRTSASARLILLHFAAHDQITLGVVAELEDVFSHELEPPFSIEGQGSWISFPHSQP